MIASSYTYQDLGPTHFERRSKQTQAQRLVRQLADLGYAVEIIPVAA
jgi:hypothetical protein